MRYQQFPDEQYDFVECLPRKLKMDVSMYLNESKFSRVNFLSNKSQKFLYWICPRLEYILYEANEYVYFEDDDVDAIYFVIGGTAHYVLPQFDDAEYILINQGSEFGLIDIAIDSICKGINVDVVNEIEDNIQRQFTIMATAELELYTLSMKDLYDMNNDFSDLYI